MKSHEAVPTQTGSSLKTADEEQRCTNLESLKHLTKRDPEMLVQIIKICLRDVPERVSKMKQGVDNLDWESVASEAHDIITSFSTMGISKSYTDMVKQIQGYARKKEKLQLVEQLVPRIETVCSKACNELEQELVSLRKIM